MITEVRDCARRRHQWGSVSGKLFSPSEPSLHLPLRTSSRYLYLHQVWCADFEGECYARIIEWSNHTRALGSSEWSVLPAFIVIFISRRAKIPGWKRLNRRI